MKKLLLFLAALHWTIAQADTVSPVEVRPVVLQSVAEVLEVNGVIRSRHDLLLPSLLDGALLWVAEEGQRVARGEVVALVDVEELTLLREEQALAIERARISFDYLAQEVSRLETLQAASLASRTQLAELVSRRDLAANDMKVARARIAQLDENLARARIVAPVDGVVRARMRQGGEFVRRGEGVLQIVDTDQLEVRVSIPASYVSRISAEQVASVQVGSTVFDSRLRSIVAATESAQTISALLDVPPRFAPSVVAGQFVRVALPVPVSEDALYVPRDAVVLRAEGNYVFRIDENNMATRVSVVLGAGQGDMVAVSGDLRAGENVAIRGVERLADGQVVRVSSS
ncbi:MAG: efflux RND transporter periplasmic adaptor subunit [Pseudomonadota bacterium]